VLTDSLTGSTMTIATCILGLIVLRRATTPSRGATAGAA
jgi:hypothetical protein